MAVSQPCFWASYKQPSNLILSSLDQYRQHSSLWTSYKKTRPHSCQNNLRHMSFSVRRHLPKSKRHPTSPRAFSSPGYLFDIRRLIYQGVLAPSDGPELHVAYSEWRLLSRRCFEGRAPLLHGWQHKLLGRSLQRWNESGMEALARKNSGKGASQAHKGDTVYNNGDVTVLPTDVCSNLPFWTAVAYNLKIFGINRHAICGQCVSRSPKKDK